MRLKLRGTPRFLASLFGGIGTKVRRDGLASYVDINFNDFAQINTIDPTQLYIPVQNADGSFARISVATILTASQLTVIKTTAGDVNVSTIDGTIIVNKTSGQATNVNMPKAAMKIGPTLVVDGKRDASTNNITMVPASGETIQGYSTYTICADGGSVFLRPVPGVGYVL